MPQENVGFLTRVLTQSWLLSTEDPAGMVDEVVDDKEEGEVLNKVTKIVDEIFLSTKWHCGRD